MSIDLKPVLFVIGFMLSILGLTMLLPMMADIYMANTDYRVFLLCITFTLFFGGALALSNFDRKFDLTVRQAFLLTGSSWLCLSLFAALPFYYADLGMSFTDSFFEAVSGITTTGATVMTGLDEAPPGILLWRGLLQWLGGIGIIVMALSILPFLKVGGMQLFRTESSEKEKAMPRAAKLSLSIFMIYLALTLLCISAYRFSGLTHFDALAHALTTISTGGYSTSDNSIGNFNSVTTEMVAVFFMAVSGMPFILFLKTINGNRRALFRNSQVRTYLGILASAIFILSLYQVLKGTPIPDALRYTSFNVVSVMTGTGYATANYTAWGSFAVAIFLFLMTIGGCAGSTTCGIKVFRFEVLHIITSRQIKKLLNPRGAFDLAYNGRPLPPDVPTSVMVFFFVFALIFAVAVLALSATGLDFVTSISGVATSLSNVGPGLGGIIGPASTFQSLPDSAKWILSFCMLLGRLELFTILVLFSPVFWRS